MNNEKYYTKSELLNGIDGLPPFTEIILRNARQLKKLKYTKIGRNCVYKRVWVIDYLKSNERGITNE